MHFLTLLGRDVEIVVKVHVLVGGAMFVWWQLKGGELGHDAEWIMGFCFRIRDVWGLVCVLSILDPLFR
jgi:hypothetical protein